MRTFVALLALIAVLAFGGPDAALTQAAGKKDVVIRFGNQPGIATASIAPPLYPATRPTSAPRVIDIMTAIVATASETRAPPATRASTSRLS